MSIERRTWRGGLTRVLLAGAIILTVTAIIARAVRLNVTESLPLGLYRVAHGPATRGALVLVCVPPRIARFVLARRYVWRSRRCTGGVAPIGKVVLARGGDTLVFTASGAIVNGCRIPGSTPLARDTRGRPLAHYPYGTYVLAPGTLWLFSPYHPRSFDSRYFGPVSASAVLARLAPVWTTRPARAVAPCAP